MNKLLVVVPVLTVLVAGSPARAIAAEIPAAEPVAEAARAPVSQLGKQGSLSLSAERLFGLSHNSASGGGSMTTFSLLGASGLEAAAAPYNIPRAAIDYFPADAFSVGLSAEFATISPDGGSSETILSLSPRLGYLVHASDALSIWPRAGISYVNASSGGRSSYLLAGTLELQFVVTPFQHIGFQFGPTLDVGLAATGSKLNQVGVQAGLLGWF